jgi:tetratricopeptide (TPR) repeat protein
MVKQSPSGRPGRPRRKVVPPPPTWPRGEATILRELRGPAGITLWQLARDVRLWSSTEVGQRRGLFRAENGLPVRSALLEAPELGEPVERLLALVRYPDLVEPTDVAAAAAEIASWAEDRELLVTALEYAEAAALADPASAAYAIHAGRIARRVGENNRGAAWYQRAIGVARGDHDAYIRAQLGYGGVLFQIGNYDQARRAFRRASRLAVKYGRRGLAAQANHDLLSIACDAGSYEQGAAAARNALERYPIRHPRLPHLAHDYAYLLMRNQYHAAAIPLLRKVLGLVNPHERIVVCGTLARSAAALGDRLLFQSVSQDVLRGAGVSEEFAAQALVHVAAGAQSLGEWDLAERVAADALAIAERRGCRRPHRDAATILEEVAVREGGKSGKAREAPLSVQLLVGEFVRRLDKRAQSDDLVDEVP